MSDPIDRYEGQKITPELLRAEADRLDETPATGQASWAMGETAALLRLTADQLAAANAAREKAEALYMHATARADETQARLTDLEAAARDVLDIAGGTADDFDRLRALVPAADTGTQDKP